jgi:hypothetical protein
MATLGKTNIGGSFATIVRWWSCKYTSIEAGTISDMSCYFAMTGPGSFKFCIWADDGSGNPGALLAQSTTDTHNTTPAWKTIAISYAFASGETLHLGVVADDWTTIYTDAGLTNQETEFTQDYTGWPTAPNPPTVLQQYNSEVSIYATYTAAAGPSNIGTPALIGVQSLIGVRSITI